VEKQRINILLNNPSEATLEDVYLLKEEVNKYPYAQVLHILLAKVLSQQNASDKNEKLTRAAIYSGDRSVLKKIILEDGYIGHSEKIIPFQPLPTIEIEVAPSAQVTETSDQNEEEDSSSIFAEVLKNLEELKSLRQQFQFLELNLPNTVQEEKTDLEEDKSETTIEKAEIKPEVTNVEKDIKPNKKDSPRHSIAKESDTKKKKLENILKQDEILDSQVNVFFLKEIEEKKETLERPVSIKHLVQKEIIERFIEEQPSIGSAKNEADKAAEEANKDLAEKSTKFNDDLVSENLAIIMLKQGKKDRAIDIYKKLIWKLPQKKAYFAARIEEINK